MVNYNTAYKRAAHKYLLKVFYNKTKKKEYNSKIWQHNICNIIIIVIEDIIIVAKKYRENERLLTIKNITKIVMSEVAKVLSANDLGSKYNWVISNIDIDIVRDLRLLGIIKY